MDNRPDKHWEPEMHPKKKEDERMDDQMERAIKEAKRQKNNLSDITDEQKDAARRTEEGYEETNGDKNDQYWGNDSVPPTDNKPTHPQTDQ